jgi:4-amino-4-deoxy-L-arabinose transferase-like glycosyltransferase
MRRTAIALGLLGLWLLFTAWLRPFALPDEGRYAGVAYEMLQRGDPLTPTLFGLPYFHKPPLMYWLDMAAFSLFGPTPFAARFAPWVGAMVLGAAVWMELRRRRVESPEFGLALLAVLPLFFGGAQYANHDMGVAGWVTMAVVCARKALDERRLGWLCAAWAAAGLALLSKGLIGVVLPGLVLAPWLAWQKRWRDIAWLLHPAGLAVLAAVTLPWLLMVEQKHPGFLDYFIVEQHFRRYTGTSFNNPHPWYFFPVVLVLLSLPLSGLLYRVRPRGESAFDLWWMLAIVLFFSLPKSKLVGYVLPALAPLALLLAAQWRTLPRARWALAASGLLCVAAIIGVRLKGPGDHADVAAALGERLGADDRIVYADEAFFDLRMHARLASVPALLQPWDAPDFAQRDSWHKEVKDAARFDAAQAERVLWTPARLEQEICKPGPIWMVEPLGWAGERRGELLFKGHRAELRRIEGQACH